MRTAFVKDNVVIAVTDGFAGDGTVSFGHADPDAVGIAVANGVAVFPGYIYDADTDTFAAPPPTPTVTPDLIVDVPTFFMLFYPTEEMAIRANEDPLLKTLLRRLDDPRTVNVNLSLPAVAMMLYYIVAISLLSADRAGDILSAIYPGSTNSHPATTYPEPTPP